MRWWTFATRLRCRSQLFEPFSFRESFCCSPLLFAFEPTRIPDFLTRGERHETFDAQVYPDELKVAALSVDSREKIGFLFADEADVVLSCGVFHRPHQLLGSDGSSLDHRMFISPGIFERRSFCFPFSSRRADIPSRLIAFL